MGYKLNSILMREDAIPEFKDWSEPSLQLEVWWTTDGQTDGTN